MGAEIGMARAAQVPARLVPAAFFELRRGLRQQGAAFGRVLMARLKSCPDTKPWSSRGSGDAYKQIPQGLKPDHPIDIIGPAKAVP